MEKNKVSLNLGNSWIKEPYKQNILYYTTNSGTKAIIDLGFKICEYLSREPSKIVLFKHFHEICEITGQFTIIIITEWNSVIIITDIIRGYPVFYRLMGDTLQITDCLNNDSNLNQDIDYDINKAEEFVVSSFVYGSQTVFQNVNCTQAGEVLIFEQTGVESLNYFSFINSPPFLECSKEELVQGIDNQLLQLFSRSVKEHSISGNWIVPLSGGHDSRIIVNYLYKLGVKNVICYSYGNKDSHQARISKNVAERLGFPWHFIEYSGEKWNELHLSGVFDDYLKFGFNGVSVPHLQDFLAVHELNKNGIIGEGDVFLPGHAFDFVAGSHLSKEDTNLLHTDRSVERVINKFAFRVSGRNKAKFINRLTDYFAQVRLSPDNFQEYFNWRERQVKFIANSVKVYEYFGYQWKMPYWDSLFVGYWLKLDKTFRISRNLLLEIEQRGLLVEELHNIPFANELSKKDQGIIKNAIKKLIPATLMSLILRMIKRTIKLDEGLNNIYTNKATTVEELIKPAEDFPPYLILYFRAFLKRLTSQVDYNFITALYCFRIAVLKKALHNPNNIDN